MVELICLYVVIIINVGIVYVGEFGGLEKIVEVKGEIFEGLVVDGIVVLNLDDKVFDIWKVCVSGCLLLIFFFDWFQVDFCVVDLQCDVCGCMGFRLQGVVGEVQVQFNLLGWYNVVNVLVVVVVVYVLGVLLDGIVVGLQVLQLVKGCVVV